LINGIKISAKDKLKIRLSPGGGWAARLSNPEK
jgi:hypothetical protein